MQFTKVWDQSYGKRLVCGLALLSGVCLITSSLFQWLEKKKAAREQAKYPSIIAATVVKLMRNPQIPLKEMVEEPIGSADKFTLPNPRERLQRAKEAVFIEEALTMTVGEVKLNIGHEELK